MSRFQKLLLALLVLSVIVFLFNFSAQPARYQSLDESKVVDYVLQEYDYEVAYTDRKIDTQAFVDQAVMKALKEKKNYKSKP